MEKYLIIGGVAAGAAFAAKMRRLDESAQITMFERGEHISYANCGLPYYIGGWIKKADDLLLHTPQSMKARFNIEALINTEVIAIDRKNKTVTAKDLLLDTTKDYPYDKLFLSPGGYAIRPNIAGNDLPNVFTIKDVRDTVNIKKYIDETSPKSVAVVGGGFIGVEMAENFHALGIKVTIIESTYQLMAPYDYEMSAILHNHLREKGVDLKLKNSLKSITKEENGLKLELETGSLNVDFVVLGIGVKPHIELAKAAGLELGATGGIKTNQYLQTSDPDIYAAGDAVEVEHKVLKKPVLIPLAGNANKQARIAAMHIKGKEKAKKPVIGTSIVKVFDLTAAVVGANEKQLIDSTIEFDKIYLHPLNHAGYYPTATSISIKLLFDSKSGLILGAQAIGKDGTDKRIDILATAMVADMTIYDLSELELAYSPPYSSARDPINYAGDVAIEVVNKRLKQVFWYDLSSIDSEKTFLVDTRTTKEYENGTIGNAVSIQLTELRQKMDELPKDKDIYLFCQTGLRGYLAVRILSQNGYNAFNLSGGYVTWHEVAKDKGF